MRALKMEVINMKHPLVSIIVPIYNGEQSIERCLCSLKAQTYQNIEVLVINDGSVDHTSQVMDEYERLDARFRMIHKENSGVSDSRNLALSLAQGEYVQFVDGDDWIPPETTQLLVEGMQQDCEMVICDYYRVVEQTIVVRGHIEVEGVISRSEFAQYMMKAPANYYYGVLWNKMFRIDILRKHALNFPQELDWCEDLQFNLEYLQFVKQVYVLQRPLYYYVLTKGSLTRVRTDMIDNLRVRKVLFEQYKLLYESLDLYEQNKMKIRRFYVDFARDKYKGFTMFDGVKKDDITAEHVLNTMKDRIKKKKDKKNKRKKHKKSKKK